MSSNYSDTLKAEFEIGTATGANSFGDPSDTNRYIRFTSQSGWELQVVQTDDGVRWVEDLHTGEPLPKRIQSMFLDQYESEIENRLENFAY